MTSIDTCSPATKAEWHRQRQTCIGGSDAPVLLGLGYKDQSVRGLWDEKVSPVPIVRDLGRTGLDGLAMEPYIRTLYHQETGQLVHHERIGHYRHLDRYWQGCTPDGFTYAPDRLVQCKALFNPPSPEWGEPGTDQVPERVIVQVQHELGVTGREVADIPVLWPGHWFRIYTVRFDEHLFEMLTAIQAAFWCCVARREEPPEDYLGTCAAVAARERLQRIDPTQRIALGATEAERASDYQELKRLIRDGIKRADALQDELRAAMGTAAVADLPDGRQLKRKTVQRKAFDVPATSYELFRVCDPKRRSEDEDE